MNAKKYLKRARLKHDKGNFDGAITDYSKAIRIDPTLAEAYSNRGAAKYAKSDYDGAIDDYSEAIRINPNHADPYNNRGAAKKAKSDYDGAVDDYLEAIRINPKHAQAYNNLGATKYDKGDFDGTIADCSEAIRIKPKYSSAYNNRGTAQKAKGDYREAIADYSKAISLNPKSATAYSNRGTAKYAKDDYRGAIVDYSKAIRINPMLAAAYNNRGAAQKAKGDYRRAIADYSEAIRIDPKRANIYNSRGGARYAKGDYRGAIVDYSKAIGINSNHVNAYYNRGIAKKLKNDLEGAIEDWEKVNQIDDTLKFLEINLWIIHEYKDGKNFSLSTLQKLFDLLTLVLESFKEKRNIVMHYTDRNVLLSIAAGEKFRLYDASGMQDDSEGLIFTDLILKYVAKKEKNEIKEFITTGTCNAFIGSFVTNSDRKSGDDMMWRLYGKHKKKEKAGCAFVFKNKDFAKANSFPSALIPNAVSKSSENIQEIEDVPISPKECHLFKVVYKSKMTRNMKKRIEEIACIVKEIYNDDNTNAVREIVLAILDFIRYRFKGKRYKRESEARLVIWRHEKWCRGKEPVKIDIPGTGRKYVECPSSIFPKKILLGPTVPSADNWKEWLNKQEAIRKRGKKVKIKKTGD